MNTRVRWFNAAATAIAIGVGLVTLLGYFVRVDMLLFVRLALVSLVSVLAAWAVLAGALNLVIVHGKRFLNRTPGWAYSIFTLLGFFGVLLANLLAPWLGGGSGAASAVNNWLLTYLIAAGGAALAGLLAFFLVFAAYRLLRGRPTTASVVFVIALVLALLAMMPWPAGAPNPDLGAGTTLRDALQTLTRVPALAGARGLLLGIALGSVATGLRLLLGLDRPYGD